MSEQVKASLSAILDNIVQNSAQLKKQVEEQRAQIAGGEDQLAKFETLIASLQVAINDEKTLEAVAAQAGANALVSPTLPEAAANEASSGAAPEIADEVDHGTLVVSL